MKRPKRFISFASQQEKILISNDEVVIAPRPRISRVRAGLSRLHDYVDRLLTNSPPHFKSLMVFTVRGERGFTLWTRGDTVEAFFSAVPASGAEEKAILEYFLALKIPPKHNFVADHDTVRSKYMVFSFPPDRRRITDFAVGAMRTIYDVGEQDELEFREVG